MESLEVKSVTFYQTVRMNGIEEKTVSPGATRTTKHTQVVFCEDKIIMRDRDWKAYASNTVIIVGLHNVRHFSVSKEVFINSEYADVFKCIGKAKKDDETVEITPVGNKNSDPTAPVIPASARPQSVNPKIGTVATPVDASEFEGMTTDEKQILLKLELTRFKIDFDKRWGHKKLLAVFNKERANM